MARSVYFAFDYQDVIDFRANVVRNHNMIEGAYKAGYFDSSIWEESKKNGDGAIRRMINNELDGTSVTVVLIGSRTYARRWVKYEIVRSFLRGNKILGIHINSIVGRDGLIKTNGLNPFEYLGFMTGADGRTCYPSEWNGASWQTHVDIEPYSQPFQNNMYPNRFFQLSNWARVYDWNQDNGYSNFSFWINS